MLRWLGSETTYVLFRRAVEFWRSTLTEWLVGIIPGRASANRAKALQHDGDCYRDPRFITSSISCVGVPKAATNYKLKYS